MAYILVVDDDACIRKSIVEFLKKSGYQVLEANRVWEAVRLVSMSHCECPICRNVSAIDLVITDMEMPLHGGHYLMKAVGKKFPQVMFIAMSGRDDLAKQAFSAGCNVFVVKPFRMAELIAIINQLFSANN